MAKTQDVSPLIVAVAALLTLGLFSSAEQAHSALPRVMSSGDSKKPASIRVRLAERLPLARIRGFDLVWSGGGKGEFRASRQSSWEIHCSDARLIEIKAVEGFQGVQRLSFADAVEVQTPAGFLTFQGKPYREMIRIHASKSGCEVVNEVGLEDYLEGIVNAEISAEWSEAAVEAQVVAARTYAYRKILESRRSPAQHYDVESTVKDQVYGGPEKEHWKASRVVDRTRGLILTASRADEPLKAFYHSTCGGLTELPQRVWGGAEAGFRRRVKCPYCRSSPAFSWKLRVPEQQIAQAIRGGVERDGTPVRWPSAMSEALTSGRLVNLVPKLDDAGRVLEVITSWQVGRSRVDAAISGVSFRGWLGAGRFKSTAFSARVEQGAWIFEGRGNGHGVGMCQWGAKVMAEGGHTMAMILRHYYPDAVLRKIW